MKSVNTSVQKKAVGRPSTISVVGQKILKTGKLGKPAAFESISKAAKKVAADRKAVTAYNNILSAARGKTKTAYGYKWTIEG